MAAYEDERLAHLVRQLERQFRRSLQRKLKQYDVMFGHWEFLRILWDEEGLSQKELADRAGLTGPTAHTDLNKMEAKGLIEKEVPEGGNSRPVIKLSPLGRSLRDKLEPLAVSTNDIAVSELSQIEVHQLRVLLLKMSRNLTADDDVATSKLS
jgi:DNA-binding MarR family transcriptional regulator